MPKVPEGVKYSKTYSENDIDNALKAIGEGLPIREASRKFKIPRATLQFRKSDKFTKTSLGPNPVLTVKEEELLVKWILDSGKKGFPRRKEDLQWSAKAILDKFPRRNPFTENFPHEGWYKAFLRRHPELTNRTPEAVTSASANVAEKDLRHWFQQIKDYLTSKGYDHILEDPTRIFNGDETAFNLCPKNTKVLAVRGTRNVYEVEHAPSKQTITVMFSFSASGLITPPLIVYPGKRLRADIAQSVPSNWGIGLSDTGWMKAEVFYEYIANVFYPYLKEKEIQFPIILYLDGHSTHLTYQLSELCKSLDIILISLYPNATRILQPADVGAFKPIKTGWKKEVVGWRRENLNDTLTKEKFAPILQKVIEKYGKEEIVKNGFRATGLYPFSPDAIDFSKCLGGRNEQDLEKSEILLTEKLLSLDDFKRMVGYAKIKELENTTEVFTQESMEDFKLLHKIWSFFTSQEKVPISEEKDNKEAQEYPLPDHEEKINVQLNTETFEIKNWVEAEDGALKEVLEQDLDNNSSKTSNYQNIEPFSYQELYHMPVVFINNDSECQPAPSTNTNPTVSMATDENTNLYNILTWPKTPKRKGLKESKKLPYVLTGTQWRHLKKEQEDDKKRIEDEKEERKRIRLEKKKNNDKVTDKKVTKKRLVPKPAGRILTEIVNQNKDLNKSESSQKYSVTNLQKATKNLFSDEETPKTNINIVSNILINSQNSADMSVAIPQNLEEIGLSSDLNINFIQGICFSCTGSFTVRDFGVKCSHCFKKYHARCIKKHDLHKSNSTVFTCLTCLKKNNNAVSKFF